MSTSVGSCTHSALGHLIHPFCPSLPVWKKVSIVAIPVLAVALLVYATRRSSTVHKPEHQPILFFGINISRLPKKEQAAFEVTQASVNQYKFYHLTFEEALKPTNESIPKIASVLRREKESLAELLMSNSWDAESVQSQAKKTMQIAYVLAYLSLDENPFDGGANYLLDENSYAVNVVLDCLSIYHLIRSRGIIETPFEGPTTYLGGNPISSDLFFESSAEINRLYSALITKRATSLQSIKWKEFDYDWKDKIYQCPLTPLPEDLITPRMRDVLNELLKGSKITVDDLPAYKGNFPLTAKEMENWIMKGVHEGRPFVAIKMRCSTSKSENIVVLSHRDKRPNNWIQRAGQEGNPFPCFFSPDNKDAAFTIYGKVTASSGQSFDLLQTLIKKGRSEDRKGMMWEIVGHPNVKLKTAKTAKMAEDRICIEVRTILDDLLGENRSVDDLPVLEHYYGLLPNVEAVKKPIMKFTGTGLAPRAGIVIKLQYVSEKPQPFQLVALLILAHNPDKNELEWIQHPIPYATYPKFFNTFTNETGQFDTRASSNFTVLKQILQGGRGKDLNNHEWKLVAE